MPLFLVATPIGNLGDITRRAESVLASASLVAAEDTRHSRVLLDHLGIHPELMSFYDQVEAERTPRILERLANGETVALISDAGTPAVADPGFRLVRAAIGAGHEVVPIPGASAVITALIGSGLPTDAFSFGGFVPRSAGRRADWAEMVSSTPHTSVWFEAPGRITKSLDALASAIPERDVCVARELTKRHEEWLRGSAAEVLATLQGRERVKGEICLVVAGAPEQAASDEEVRRYVDVLRAEELPPAVIRRVVRSLLGVKKSEVFAAMQDARDEE